MKRVAIIGATGYSGAELAVILNAHPGVELCALQSSAGRKEDVAFASLHAKLRGLRGPACEPFAMERLLATRPDFVFLATPNETSAELAGPLVDAGLRVIDISGAHRLPDAAQHERWYGFPHPRKDALAAARYRLPELLDDAARTAMREDRLIANPGCYATSVILALAPLQHLAHATEATIADCKSGVTGAGKRAELAYSFTELAGNFKVYGQKGHRHEPEIRRAIGWGDARPFVFVPHLLPVPRGILSTLHVPFRQPVDEATLAAAFDGAYGRSPFVGVRPAGELPELNDVVGTPRCELGFHLLAGGRRAIVVSVLDNLLKGAASLAVQSFNLACGLSETTGLI